MNAASDVNATSAGLKSPEHDDSRRRALTLQRRARRTIWLAGVIALGLGAVAQARAATDWHAVEDILGRKGEVDEGVLRVNFDRSDLHVTKDGVPVAAELVLDCWYGFWPMKDGTVMLMGDTCVREDELPAVEQEIHQQGLDLTALHNHLTGETPKVIFMHMAGRGTAADLARKVKAVLAKTGTPTGPEPDDDETQTTTGARDRSAIAAVLGPPTETKGDIVDYGYQRRETLRMHGEVMPSTDALETAPEVKFQSLAGGRAITYGEMILTASEVAPVFHALIDHGIEVDALHNHMVDEEPRLFFLHWWAVGRPGALARGVKAALGQMAVSPGK
jgi:hypothetical protein